MTEEFFAMLRSFGASDSGVARVGDGPAGLPYAVSVVARLSDATLDEVADGPTYTYFHHYRSVNFLIDQITLRAGLWLQSRGARYIAIAASQSKPDLSGRRDSSYEGRYPHKKAACLAGLGTMGRNCLFCHREWGPRVRLGTLFTDWEEFEEAIPLSTPPSVSAPGSAVGALDPACDGCSLCAARCPAKAIGISPDAIEFDAAACSAWMKKAYMGIGRGAVCGICVSCCPRGNASRR